MPMRLLAQEKIDVVGVIRDTTGIGLQGATVIVSSSLDTVKTISSFSGRFSCSIKGLDSIKIGVKLIGYGLYEKKYRSRGEPILEIGSISLKIASQLLKTVEINEKKGRSIYKKDTVEYDISPYFRDSTELIGDLMRRLPELNVDKEGNVGRLGESLFKLRVNGKDFFTGNINKYIKLLPSGIFEKIQIIDDYGEDTVVNGKKLAKAKKILNLVTNNGINSGNFSNAIISGGNDNRLGLSVGSNHWRNSTQIAGNINLNKINSDLGLNANNTASASARAVIAKKIEVTSEYSYLKNRNSSTKILNSDMVTDSGFVYTESSTDSYIESQTHRLNTGMKITANPRTQINVNSTLTYNDAPVSVFSTLNQSGQINQKVENRAISESKKNEYDIETSIVHKFKKNGRAISLSWQENRSSSKGLSKSINDINASSATSGDGYAYLEIESSKREIQYERSLAVTYTEPISNYAKLYVSYSRNTTKQTSELENLQTMADSNDFASGVIRYKSTIELLEARAIIEHKRVEMNMGVNLQISNVRSSTNDGRPFFKRSAVLFPNAEMKVSIPKNRSFLVSYSANSILPTLDQLQTQQNIDNIAERVIGNSELLPALEHSFETTFKRNDNGRSYIFKFSGQIINNEIAINRVIATDSLGVQYQKLGFENVNGSYKTAVSYNYYLPVPLKKSSLSFNAGASLGFINQISLVDSIRNTAKTVSFLPELSSKFSFGGNTIIGMVKYSKMISRFDEKLQPNPSELLLFSINGFFNFGRFSFNSDVSKSVNSGYSASTMSNPLTINLAITRQLFKSKSGYLSIQLNDLLNQGNSPRRSTLGNGIIDEQIILKTRTVLLTFGLRLSKFSSRNL